MKKMIILFIASLVLSCAGEKELSPSETAKIVAESFYYGDKETLQKYTTKEGYANLVTVQNMFQEDKESKSNFEVIDEKAQDVEVWIKYTTSFDLKPGIFKLVKENGQWKVTHNGPRDNGPF